MKFPYIKVTQKGESFLITKFNAEYLREHVNFHFRNPYTNQSLENNLSSEKYIELLSKKGMNIKSDPQGIQRRMNIEKINDIKRTMELESEIMPNAVLLCLDFDSLENLYSHLDTFYEKFQDEFGVCELDDNIRFKVVDGQHRLAGIFSCTPKILSDINIPVILLLDCSNEIVSKIFSDINGKQSRVNTSIILDLLGEQSPTDKDKILDKKLHNICKQLNEKIESPFYRHIKMLGYGTGTVSQSFLVHCLRNVIKKSNKECDETFFTNLYLYFTAIQIVFSNYWPVPFDSVFHENEYLISYSNKMIKNSPQIMKTNGIGALFKVLPAVFEQVNYDEKNEEILFSNYLSIVGKISSFDWVNDDLVKNGSGEKTQNLIADKLIIMLKKKV